MKFITVTESQRTLLKALYEQRGMRYIVHDRLGDTFSKLGEIETASRFWNMAEEIREKKHNK